MRRIRWASLRDFHLGSNEIRFCSIRELLGFSCIYWFVKFALRWMKNTDRPSLRRTDHPEGSSSKSHSKELFDVTSPFVFLLVSVMELNSTTETQGTFINAPLLNKKNNKPKECSVLLPVVVGSGHSSKTIRKNWCQTARLWGYLCSERDRMRKLRTRNRDETSAWHEHVVKSDRTKEARHVCWSFSSVNW